METQPHVRVKPFTEQIVDHLESHPGWFRGVEIARALDADVNTTASRLLYLHAHGRIRRQRSDIIRSGPGSSLFASLH